MNEYEGSKLISNFDVSILFSLLHTLIQSGWSETTWMQLVSIESLGLFSTDSPSYSDCYRLSLFNASFLSSRLSLTSFSLSSSFPSLTLPFSSYSTSPSVNNEWHQRLCQWSKVEISHPIQSINTLLYPFFPSFLHLSHSSLHDFSSFLFTVLQSHHPNCPLSVFSITFRFPSSCRDLPKRGTTLSLSLRSLPFL